MKQAPLYVSFETVNPATIVHLIPRLNMLRLDGITGMYRFLEGMRDDPAYMEANARVALAKLGSEVIGWATVCLDARQQARFNCFVEEAHRGLGIGSELVRQLVNIYMEVAVVPPVVHNRYLSFYSNAAPELFARRKE